MYNIHVSYEKKMEKIYIKDIETEVGPTVLSGFNIIEFRDVGWAHKLRPTLKLRKNLRDCTFLDFTVNEIKTGGFCFLFRFESLRQNVLNFNFSCRCSFKRKLDLSYLKINPQVNCFFRKNKLLNGTNLVLFPLPLTEILRAHFAWFIYVEQVSKCLIWWEEGPGKITFICFLYFKLNKYYNERL